MKTTIFYTVAVLLKCKRGQVDLITEHFFLLFTFYKDKKICNYSALIDNNIRHFQCFKGVNSLFNCRIDNRS